MFNKIKNLILQKEVPKKSMLSLVPGVMEGGDRKKIEPYISRLKEAIGDKDIRNIALSGKYGSGKSTILKTFKNEHKKKAKFLNISLLSLCNDKSDNKNIELSLLQQIFYHVKPTDVPHSGLKRINNSKRIKDTIAIMIFLISSFMLSKFGITAEDFKNLSSFILSKLEIVEDFKNPLQNSFFLLPILSLSLFLISAFFLLRRLLKLFDKSKIIKLNIKGEIELDKSEDTSVLNKHLDEIIHFFKETKFSIVIFEDLDRFDNSNIFNKLREINILLNNSKLITKPINFIYAIKDDVFKEGIDRCKFFDYIIPVVPFINSSNSQDQLKKLLEEDILEKGLNRDFYQDIIAFIGDIDMRLLKNIVTEYETYKDILLESHSETENNNEQFNNKLFSLIIYKNIQPKDFSKLQQNEGELYKFFDLHKNDYQKKKIEDIKSEIKEKESEIERLKDENIQNVTEIEDACFAKIIKEKIILEDHALYVLYCGNNIINNINKLEEIILKGNTKDFEARKLDSSFRVIFRYTIKNQHILNCLQEFNERKERIEGNKNNKAGQLKKEIKELEKEIKSIKQRSSEDLIKKDDTDEYLSKLNFPKYKELIKYLLMNGYINEYYYTYISLFHEGAILQTEHDFIKDVVNKEYKENFDFEIKNCKEVIKRIGKEHFRDSSLLLNYNILQFLLSNPLECADKLENFYSLLTNYIDVLIDFTNGYIDYQRPQNTRGIIHIFMKNLMIEISKRGIVLPNLESAEEDLFVINIFKYANNIKDLCFLQSFLSSKNNFFKFCSELKNTDTLQNFIKEKEIRFKNLDNPNESQKDLFEVIYHNNLYEANIDNIIVILQEIKPEIIEKQLRESTYTTLKELDNEENLIKYKDAELKAFFEKIFCLDSNNNENVESIIELLNNDTIDDPGLQLKEKFLKNQNNKIKSLELIEKQEVKKIILQTDKMICNWGNIYNYYKEEQKIDGDLIDFLNRNYSSLEKIDKTEGDGERNKFFNSLIYCNKANNTAYKKIIECLNNIQNISLKDGIDDDKLSILINQKKLLLNKENINFLKNKEGNNLHIDLIKQHLDVFKEEIEVLQESLDNNDWLLLLSSDIKTPDKQFLISGVPDSIIKNREVAEQILLILSKSDSNELEYNKLLLLLETTNQSNNDYLETKINLITQNSTGIDIDKIKQLIMQLPENYRKIYEGLNPKFGNTNYHNAFFKILKERGLISSLTKIDNSDEIRVYSRRLIKG
ncbi:hypothetical protein N9O56_02430 [Rickettsiales bacterium]|nr:hypothetical protein [Rickettsiales bacterium]